ncbi:hypothetical protein BT96DRAFT_912799 [Gymnopus androsaceus JB14]|uniref:F-box domain-containing protein n=1 Tax=Gymnopus androsaceus JB14 TaxID=1447944 RepID=A0A6A4IGX6_9AGAR|nr:hypothetical protein BT96DRAFT_912799 [Gymnopus androsaceus JB14]
MYQNLSRFQELPDVLWILIFEQLTRPQDRYHVVQTCRKFYFLALRALYGELTYRHISHFLDNYSSFWANRGDDMTTAPRSVHIYKSFMPSVEYSSGLSWDLPASHWPDESTVLKSRELPSMFMQSLAMFPNIRTLIFDNVTLPSEFYPFLFLFPQLRELTLLDCTAPCLYPLSSGESKEKTFSFEDLPITTLRLTGIRRSHTNVSTMFSAVGSMVASEDVDHYNLLHLAAAKNLHHLHITWNIVSAKFFGALAQGRVVGLDFPDDNDNSSGHERRTWTFPPQLESLRLSTRMKPDWFHLSQTSRQSERRNLTKHLSFLLKECRGTLRKLEIEGYVHPFWDPRKRVTMSRLEVYEGPLEFLKSVWTPKVDLKHIRIVEMCHSELGGRRDGLSWTMLRRAFSEKRGKSRDFVRSLDVKILVWEDRTLKDIASMFEKLDELKIEIVEGFPDQAELSSMAHRYLTRLKSLSTFELFNSGPVPLQTIPMPPSSLFSFPSSSSSSQGGMVEDSDCFDRAVSQLLSAWDRHLSHSLSEIRLTPTCVWRRANGDDQWCKRMLDLTGATSDKKPIELDALIPRNDLLLSHTIDHTHDHGPDHATPFAGMIMILETIGSYSDDRQSRANLRRELFESEQWVSARLMRDAHALLARARRLGADVGVFVEDVD